MFNDDVVCECWDGGDNGLAALAYEHYCIEENLFSALKALDYDYSVFEDVDGNCEVLIHTKYYISANMPIDIRMPIEAFLVLMKHQE